MYSGSSVHSRSAQHLPYCVVPWAQSWPALFVKEPSAQQSENGKLPSQRQPFAKPSVWRNSPEQMPHDSGQLTLSCALVVPPLVEVSSQPQPW